MPKAKPKWNKNGPFAAQLFRDFYFGKYGEKTIVKEIHADATRSYSQLSLNGFHKHVKDTRNRVTNYKRLGTGLDCEEFRNLVKLNDPPPPVDRAPAPEEFSSEDESFALGDDLDDDTLGDLIGFDIDSAFEELRFTGGIADVNKDPPPPENPEPKAKVPAPTTTPRMRAAVTEDMEKHLCTYADGRVVAVCQLASGWRGEFRLSDDCKSIIRTTEVRPAIVSAVVILKRLGLPTDNINRVNLQAHIDEKKKKHLSKQSREHGTRQPVLEDTVFALPFEVKPKFCDHEGVATNDVNIDCAADGTEWAYMFMQGIHAKVEEHSRPKMRRPTKNTRDVPADEGINQQGNRKLGGWFSGGNDSGSDTGAKNMETDTDIQDDTGTSY
jgi:hypothetical protein